MLLSSLIKAGPVASCVSLHAHSQDEAGSAISPSHPGPGFAIGPACPPVPLLKKNPHDKAPPDYYSGLRRRGGAQQLAAGSWAGARTSEAEWERARPE